MPPNLHVCIQAELLQLLCYRSAHCMSAPQHSSPAAMLAAVLHCRECSCYRLKADETDITSPTSLSLHAHHIVYFVYLYKQSLCFHLPWYSLQQLLMILYCILCMHLLISACIDIRKQTRAFVFGQHSCSITVCTCIFCLLSCRGAMLELQRPQHVHILHCIINHCIINPHSCLST